MKTPRKPKHISKADWDAVDVPELTDAELATMRPLREVFPDIAAWSRRRRAKKGEAHKQAVSIRLSPEVIAFFKARGAGWQTRINRALMAIVEASR
jgi:uncharacterized protein (DUF4415 family)